MLFRSLHYLSVLLDRPNQEVHVLDLTSAGTRAPTGGEHDIVDRAGLARLRGHVADLESDIDSAREGNDIELVTRLEVEREAVIAELAKITGLGGRSRRSVGAAERARISVTKALRTAIEHIAAAAPPVGAHLDRSIRTGARCVYRPEDGRVIEVAT